MIQIAKRYNDYSDEHVSNNIIYMGFGVDEYEQNTSTNKRARIASYDPTKYINKTTRSAAVKDVVPLYQ